MNEEKDNYEFDILQMLVALLRKWWLVLLCALLAAVLTFGYTFCFVTPMYTARIMMYVNNSSISSVSQSISSITSGDITAAKTLVDTYCVILETRLTINDVIDEAKKEIDGFNYNYNSLCSMISAGAVNSTEVFYVDVKSSKPEEAMKIANIIARVLPNNIQKVVEGSSVKVVDYAETPSQRSSPSYTKNTLLGFIVGAAICIVGVLLAYRFNSVIQSEEWLLTTFGDEIPLLSVIPDTNSRGKRRYGKYGGYYKYGYGYGYYSSKPNGGK